jgi:hypothetical protein
VGREACGGARGVRWGERRAVGGCTTPFAVARNKRIVPKLPCIERLPSGYSIREFSNHP